MVPFKSIFLPAVFAISSLPKNRNATRVIKIPNADDIKNIDRHPRYWVKNPPKNGPNASPRYTPETDIPSTLPRCCGKNAETRMAAPVVLLKAAPIPCKNRKKISQCPEIENPLNNDEMVKITIPVLNNLLIPVKSPHLPTGSKNMAVDKRKAVTTQLNVTASRPKSLSMEGRAMFTDDIRKVPKNELDATIARIDICFFVQFILKNYSFKWNNTFGGISCSTIPGPSHETILNLRAPN